MMRIEYLADALDHFKGAVLRQLVGTDRPLRDLVVDPMATDEDRWTSEHYQLYAALLGVNVDQVVRDDGTLNHRGRRSLGRPDEDGDLFLDPDTGVRPPSGYPIRHYVRAREVRTLTAEAPARIVAVYQHARRSHSDQWAGEVVDRVQEEGDVRAVGYVSRQVAILFFSRDVERLRSIASALDEWTQPVSESVIRRWHA